MRFHCWVQSWLEFGKKSPSKLLIPPVGRTSWTRVARYASAAGRTHMCGALNASHEGQSVVLCGWFNYKMLRKDKYAFLKLKDRTGDVQVTIYPRNEAHCAQTLGKLEGVAEESVLRVHGLVALRPASQRKLDTLSGCVEVIPESISVLNPCKRLPIPMSAISGSEEISESLRLKYRYLDLRRPAMSRMLQVRSELMFESRKFFRDLGFLEVDTPTLFRMTPEGAREFLVPTRTKGKFYTLVQSPQQYKQLLMVSGVDKYFQFARCYRDEDLRADRQPEFTQLDLEMSFVTQHEIQAILEDYIQHICKKCFSRSVSRPFPRLNYQDSMRRFGVDKPDLRFGMEILDLNPPGSDASSESICEGNSSRKYSYGLMLIQGSGILDSNWVKTFLEEASLKHITLSSVNSDALSKHATLTFDSFHHLISKDPTSTLLIASGDSPLDLFKYLGSVRVQWANILESHGVSIRDPDEFKFLWVENFPLFERSDEGDIQSTHHPFTAPLAEHSQYLYEDPLKATGQHYDLVLNGSEVGGGSIRIHDYAMQEFVVTSILGKSSHSFQHLLEALQSGCPPHGGLALGFDRLLANLCGSKSLRDVIPFPKGFHGQESMTGSPSHVEEEVLRPTGLCFSKD